MITLYIRLIMIIRCLHLELEVQLHYISIQNRDASDVRGGNNYKT